MRINTNISAISALNNLRFSNIRTNSSMERLSSGLRINRGADDPSGLGIAKRMEARMRGLQTSLINIEDTINMIHTTEGTMEEATQMLFRLRELAVRGANEAVLTAAERSLIQNEVESLLDGIQQLGTLTTYNTKHITSSGDEYNETLASITVNDWAGPAPPAMPGDPEYDAMKQRVLNSLDGAMKKVYGYLGISPDSTATITINFVNIDGSGNTLATGGGGLNNMVINIDVFDFLDPDGAGPGTPTVGYDPATNAFTPEMVLAHEMTHAIVVGMGGGAGSSWGQELTASVVSQEMDLRIAANPGGVAGAVGGGLTSAPASSDEYAEVALAGNFIYRVFGSQALDKVVDKVTQGVDFDQAVMDVLGQYFDTFADFETAADASSLDYINRGAYGAVERTGFGWTNIHSAMTYNGPGFEYQGSSYQGPANMYFMHIGPNADAESNLAIKTPWITAGSLDYLAFVNVETTEDAQRSIDTVDRALDMLNTARAFNGMQERRLHIIINDINTELINLASAKSRIMDADMATQITDFVRSQLLQQTGNTMVAQSNIQQSSILLLMQENLS
ncbi:MAG: flagellin [bacterium]